MGRYSNVERQLAQLQEVQEIIASMKTLSQLELHKLGELSAQQSDMATMLEAVLADFFRFHPYPSTQGGGELWLLIGAERGFCGDFNEVLIKRLLQECPGCRENPRQVLAVGRKLGLRLDEVLPGYTPLVGASISEELPQILAQVVEVTREQLMRQQAVSMQLLSHVDEQGGARRRRLLPPELPDDVTLWRSPPMLQMEPETFLAGFLQHYLYLGLSEAFTLSLLAESHYRVRHLEGAVRRLDERLEVLGNRAKTLRQEEITEEIETMLLGSDMQSGRRDGADGAGVTPGSARLRRWRW